MRRLVLGHLYPRLMNLYGDRGNVICLLHRARERGIALEVMEINPGDRLGDCDLLFLGGGQDREQILAAADLQRLKGEICAAVEDGIVSLAICGGYQLFGHYYRPAAGPELPGLGIFDTITLHKGAQAPRCIGNILVEWQGEILVGFENHGGRTYLGSSAQPLGRVLHGYGNNAEDGTEGACYKNAFGTYLHGSLLPKNPGFADHLLGLALERRYGAASLEPLEDTLEMMAHRAAMKRARGSR